MLSRLSLLFIFVAACGGKTLEPLDDAGNDASSKPDVITFDAAPPFDAMPPPPPPTDGGACNNVDPGNLMVSIAQTQSSPPPFASAGDTIQPGLWALAELTLYGASGPGSIVAARMRVYLTSNGYIFEVGSISDNQAPQHSTEQLQVFSPPNVIITETCNGSPNQYKGMISAQPTTLLIRIYEGGLVADESWVYLGP